MSPEAALKRRNRKLQELQTANQVRQINQTYEVRQIYAGQFYVEQIFPIVFKGNYLKIRANFFLFLQGRAL
jgi:hypothetical protein